MLEMADIFRLYGPAYRAQYQGRLLPSHERTMQDIVRCRTPLLGGQVFECTHCHEIEYSYHSCMNRHCPKCQNDAAEQWLQKQRKLLLPVPYFLVTFTIPKELRSVTRSNQKIFYRILFQTSAAAMQKLALDPKYLGGQIGAIGNLHTWTRTMTYHPHVHYLVPAVGVSKDGATWVKGQKKFFLPVTALSKIFRAMFRDALKEAAPELFNQIPKTVWKRDWVVHCKSAGNGDSVLKYFAPYIFRVAISNRRLVKLEKGCVTFRYKHPKTKKWCRMTLPVFEFMRRFLQHVLPSGFKKVRHYGFMSAKHKQTLARLKLVLGEVETEPTTEPVKSVWRPLCPVCGHEMRFVMCLAPYPVRASPDEIVKEPVFS
jgi:hypothetical protein